MDGLKCIGCTRSTGRWVKSSATIGILRTYDVYDDLTFCGILCNDCAPEMARILPTAAWCWVSFDETQVIRWPKEGE